MNSFDEVTSFRRIHLLELVFNGSTPLSRRILTYLNRILPSGNPVCTFNFDRFVLKLFKNCKVSITLLSQCEAWISFSSERWSTTP